MKNKQNYVMFDFLIWNGWSGRYLIRAQQIVCQHRFGQERVLPGWNAAWRIKIKPVGNTGADFMVSADPKHVFIAILIDKDNIMAVL